jgi:uncharacterized protein YciI
MLYFLAGILKPGSDDQLIKLHNEWNEHLSQPFPKVSLFGLLRGQNGMRKGYLALIEAKSFEDVDAFLKQSPFYRDKLYERIEVAEFIPQVGEVA